MLDHRSPAHGPSFLVFKRCSVALPESKDQSVGRQCRSDDDAVETEERGKRGNLQAAITDSASVGIR